MTLIEEFKMYCKEHALPDSVAVWALYCAWKEAESKSKLDLAGYFAIFKFDDSAKESFMSIEEFEKKTDTFKSGYWFEPIYRKQTLEWD